MSLVLIKLKNAPSFAVAQWLVGKLDSKTAGEFHLKDTCVIYEYMQLDGTDPLKKRQLLLSTCAAQGLYTEGILNVPIVKRDFDRLVTEGEGIQLDWQRAMDAYRLEKAGLHAPGPVAPRPTQTPLAPQGLSAPGQA